MHTKQDLINDIRNMGILPNDTLMLHTSLKKIGAVENGGDTVIDAFCEYMKDGLLVVPGHTWAYVTAENPVFDVMESPVCVGVLPELFRKRSGVYRSLHPTHSLLAFGRDAQHFVAGQQRFDTPCSPHSCYGDMEKRDGKVMLLGVNFTRCTLIHCIEEIAEVPDRLTDSWENLKVKAADGEIMDVPSRRHGNADSEKYQKMEAVLEHRGVLTRGKVGDADTLVCGIKDLFRITLELLEKNIRLFDDNNPVG